ncbi:MAG: hypothetical protein EP302_08960 [Bacteroidetes bacterium]|nr:MAG: hypothetical protein EP302_08960 [Bacteroidota bacterium]
MCDWAWHSYPLPPGATKKDVPETGTIETGKLEAPMVKASANEEVSRWMFRNPHRFTMGRIRFIRTAGDTLSNDEISITERELNIWQGIHTTSFRIDKKHDVKVRTVVHPEDDLIAFHIESEYLGEKGLSIELSFPYPMEERNRRVNVPWHGHWNLKDRHSTIPEIGGRKAIFRRWVDSTQYVTTWHWNDANAGLKNLTDDHTWLLTPSGKSIDFICVFGEKEQEKLSVDYKQIESLTSESWKEYWNSGGAVDLSESKDERWKELERRVVLSQYLMKTQSSGLWPPSELSLMGVDPWSTQFHMEMIWWHMAHYGLWDRWDLAGESLSCYQKFLPVARKLARQFGYKGAKWGKQVGPEGRTAPWNGSFLLHWQQPHPIFFAELEFRLKPSKETLVKWDTIVMETAEYMADFPTQGEDGKFHLTPVRTANENDDGTDPAFELAYWYWALEKAQEWRVRLHGERESKWDSILNNLAPLPQHEGLYLFCDGWYNSYSDLNEGHPDPLGTVAFLPLSPAVDAEVASRTVRKIADEWRWERTWGWDFPWAAMAAARMGHPGIAVDILLKDVKKNSYTVNGINDGWYFPGNGGVLYAVAMMAAGWDGAPSKHAPGFPDDGSWVVKWEGLQKAL